MKRHLLGSLMFLCLSSVSALSLAQMYKCVGPSGAKTFSDKPCGTNTQVHVVANTGSSGYDSSSTTLTDSGYRPSYAAGQINEVVVSNSRHFVETRTVGHVVVEHRREAPVRQAASRRSDK